MGEIRIAPWVRFTPLSPTGQAYYSEEIRLVNENPAPRISDN